MLPRDDHSWRSVLHWCVFLSLRAVMLLWEGVSGAVLLSLTGAKTSTLNWSSQVNRERERKQDLGEKENNI